MTLGEGHDNYVRMIFAANLLALYRNTTHRQLATTRRVGEMADGPHRARRENQIDRGNRARTRRHRRTEPQSPHLFAAMAAGAAASGAVGSAGGRARVHKSAHKRPRRPTAEDYVRDPTVGQPAVAALFRGSGIWTFAPTAPPPAAPWRLRPGRCCCCGFRRTPRVLAQGRGTPRARITTLSCRLRGYGDSSLPEPGRRHQLHLPAHGTGLLR